MVRARSEQRKIADSATSSSAGISPSGMLAVISPIASSSVMPRSATCHCTYICTGGPHIHVGTTVFTRIFRGPSALARWNIAARSAPFDDAYASCSITGGSTELCDPMSTMEPPRSPIASTIAETTCIEPTTLVSKMARQSSSPVPSSPARKPSYAATCTTPSTAPNRSTASCAKARHCSASPMSVGSCATRSPLGSSSSAIAASLSAVRAASTALPPSRSTSFATSPPSPGPTPVTTTVLPSRIIVPPFRCEPTFYCAPEQRETGRRRGSGLRLARVEVEHGAEALVGRGGREPQSHAHDLPQVVAALEHAADRQPQRRVPEATLLIGGDVDEHRADRTSRDRLAPRVELLTLLVVGEADGHRGGGRRGPAAPLPEHQAPPVAQPIRRSEAASARPRSPAPAKRR